MAFNILDRDYKYTEDLQPTGAVCSVYCDSANDLPTAADIARENILPGSWAWLATEKDFRTLSTAKEWI